jgi:hypothetical protein
MYHGAPTYKDRYFRATLENAYNLGGDAIYSLLK